MQSGALQVRLATGLPGWVPEEARRYLLHTEAGLSIRALARGEGAHASTVLRQVRRVETRRDDPLVDEALKRLVAARMPANPCPKRPEPEDLDSMTAHPRTLKKAAEPDAASVDREARRILRRLSESGAVLAVAPDLDRAVVMRDLPDGRSTRTAVLDRAVAQAFALKDWIARRAGAGRVATYEITAAGRAALKRLLAEDQAVREGFAEAPGRFAEQHRDWGEKHVAEDGEGRKRIRYNVAENPLAALARRREKDGAPFLAPELVAAGERLREDFELAQMGPRVTQNWDRFLTAGSDRGMFPQSAGRTAGPEAARARVAAALAELGPGLGDVVLRVCCFLEGLEAAEKRMGWAARSGKIVLRIALLRLRRHYDETEGRYGAMIG
jgi:DNA-binding PadR family transcriptional regulator